MKTRVLHCGHCIRPTVHVVLLEGDYGELVQCTSCNKTKVVRYDRVISL